MSIWPTPKIAAPKSKTATVALLALGFALPAAASKLSRSALGAGYESLTDSEAPDNPASPSIHWREAVFWTLLTGAVGGVTKLLVRRALAGTSIPSKGFDRDLVAEDLAE